MKPIDTKSVVLFSRLTASLALIALGTVLLFAVLQVSGNIGYSEGYTHGTEWLNFSWAGYEQIDDVPVWGWSESSVESGYALARSFRSIMLPTQLIVGIFLLLAGLRLFPTSARE